MNCKLNYRIGDERIIVKTKIVGTKTMNLLGRRIWKEASEREKEKKLVKSTRPAKSEML